MMEAYWAGESSAASRVACQLRAEPSLAIGLDADEEIGNALAVRSLAEENVLGANGERDGVASERTFDLRVLTGGFAAVVGAGRGAGAVEDAGGVGQAELEQRRNGVFRRRAIG